MQKLLRNSDVRSYQTLGTEKKEIPTNDRIAPEPDKNPEDKASHISRLFFWWLFPIIKKINKEKTFEIQDIYPVRDFDESRKLHSNFKRCWEGSTKPKSLVRTLITLMRFQLVVLCLSSHIVVFITVGQTYLAGNLVGYFNDSNQNNQTEALLSAAGLVFVTALYAVFYPTLQYQGMRVGVQTRAILGAAIYGQMLEISNNDLTNIGSGEIMTLLSTDLEIIAQPTRLLHHLFPVMAVCSVLGYLLYREIGLACLSGLLYNMLAMLLMFFAQPLTSKLRGSVASRSSERIKTMGDIIKSIEVIKLYCWEKTFAAALNSKRKKEVDKLTLMCVWLMLLKIFYYTTNIIPLCLTVATFIFNGGVLSSSMFIRAFGYLYLFGYQSTMASYFIVQYGVVYKSLKRIEDCLKRSRKAKQNHSNRNKFSVSCSNLAASWCGTMVENGLNKKTINDISFDLKKGNLLIVVGPTGAGKTALLMTLLGNLDVSDGSYQVPDSVSYASQEPWIISDTIEKNILLGSPKDLKFYNQVIESCGLVQDFASFPHGDGTMIGERGLNLSGGQKARVALARCVYQNKDLILLDDPLSAVDNSVGEHIFHKCIAGLLGKKTRILVTHHLKYLPYADTILALDKKGQLTFYGNFKDGENSFTTIRKEDMDQNSQIRVVNSGESSEGTYEVGTVEKDLHESTEQGEISWSVYKSFFIAGKGFFTLLPAFLVSGVGNAVLKYNEWILSHWTEEPTGIIFNETKLKQYVTMVGLYVLSISLMCIFITLFVRFAAQNLHNKMFQHVINAKMTFFIRPLGTILNRFSRDLGMIDTLMSYALSSVIYFSMLIPGMFIFSCFVMPWLLLALIPYIIAVVAVAKYGYNSCREFRRMEATCRSPLYTHVSNTISGHVHIQTMKKENYFMDEFHKHQNLHTSAYNLFMSTFIWIGLNVSLLSVCYYIAMISTSFALNKDGNGTISALIIVTIGHAIDLIQTLNFQTIEFNMMMTSVEKILSYTCLEQEESSLHPVIINPDWPSEGVIGFENVYLKYDNTDSWALNNFSFTAKCGEKVGIIGRTGAGKSSIFKAFTRLAEYDGKITIDGIDILDVNLTALRKSISVISQNPIIFNGTLRKNIDPFNESDDKDIWTVLDNVQLGDYARNLPTKLETELGEGKIDLSVGQKQLLSLARAILRGTKIIIMDEATANVDISTDRIIQTVIKARFRDCTVLTIAHRIETVLGYDRILVVDEGKAVQYDKPLVVLSYLSDKTER